MCGKDTKGQYKFDRVAANAAAEESRSTGEANAARATSWPTTSLTRRVRGIVAFIVGTEYWAREIIKARYRVLKFTTAPPAIALCNYGEH